MKAFSRIIFGIGLFIFLFAVVAPVFVDAQSSSRGFSSYRSKINKLDDDEVKNLPIPILFGVTLKNITPNFGDPRGGGTRKHEGLDIMAPQGAPIVSPTKAVVVRTGSGSSSGKTVSTANPGGETFIYMHLSEILVKGGDELDVGDIIGYVGNTGNASGGAPHLHFEIRSGRKATDPFPRLTREFTLENKIDYLNDALKKSKEEEDLLEFIVKNYSRELLQAKAAGVELSTDMQKALLMAPIAVQSTGVIATDPGDLALGSRGPLVTALQQFLITKAIGPAAQSLTSAGATGYFGPVTVAALVEYQLAKGITPATGYYGPKTRAYMEANQL